MGRNRKIVIKERPCDSSTGSCYDSSSYCGRCEQSSNDCCCSSSSSSRDCKPKVVVIEADASTRSSSCRSCDSTSYCSCNKRGCTPKNNYHPPQPRYDPCNRCGNHCGGKCNNNNSYGNAYYCFQALVRPVKNFTLLTSQTECDNTLNINVAINCKTVTLQWEGFTGQVDSSGAAAVYVNQSFRGRPKKSVFSSFLGNFKGSDGLSTVEVGGCDQTISIAWYFFPSRKNSNVSNGESFTVYSGSITYILTDDYH